MTIDTSEAWLRHEAERDLLARLSKIQVLFVEDPSQSALAADLLVLEIAGILARPGEDHRSNVAAGLADGTGDTEQLRSALWGSPPPSA
jgi:hypothetical protein